LIEPSQRTITQELNPSVSSVNVGDNSSYSLTQQPEALWGHANREGHDNLVQHVTWFYYHGHRCHQDRAAPPSATPQAQEKTRVFSPPRVQNPLRLKAVTVVTTVTLMLMIAELP
jgi:hypothetical protein